MATVVALLPDLLFGSKVAAMLSDAGHDVVTCTQEDQVRGQADRADVLVVDLTTDLVDGVMLVDSMRSGGELPGVPVLGYYRHTDTDTREQAETAGFSLVVPRSRMAREAAELVAGLAG